MRKGTSIRIFILMVLSFMPACLWALTAEDHYNTGYQAYQKGDWATALSELTSATQMNPSYWEAYQLLSYASYKNGNVAQAIQYGDTSLGLFPHNPTLKDFVGRLKSNTMPAPPDLGGAPQGIGPAANNPDAPPAVQSSDPNERINSLSFGLGLTSPYAPNDFSDYWGKGFGFGAGYTVGLNRKFSLLMDLHYSNFNWNYTVAGVTTNGGGLNLMDLMVNVRLDFTDRDNPVVFYGLLGAGPSILTIETLTASGPGGSGAYPGFSETDFGLRLGIGIDVWLVKNLYLTFESNGVDTFTSQKVTTDGYITHSFVNVGLRMDIGH